MTSVELPHRIQGLPAEIARDWVRVASSSSENDSVLFGSSRITKLRLLASRCSADAFTAATLSAAGIAVTQAENTASNGGNEASHSHVSPRKTNKAMAKTGMTIPDATKSDKIRSFAPNSKSLAELNAIANSRQNHTIVQSFQTTVDLDGISVDVVRDGTTPIDLTNVTIGRSGSSKLDYILEEVHFQIPFPTQIYSDQSDIGSEVLE